MESKFSPRSTLGIDLGVLFSDLVRTETELWDRVDHRLRHDHDLPCSWFEPMQLIDRLEGCRVIDIARTLSITVGGASKLVDRIEQAGWCDRVPNLDDARSSILQLTPVGRQILARAQESFDDELRESLAAVLSPADLESFATSLRTARHALARQKGATR